MCAWGRLSEFGGCRCGIGVNGITTGAKNSRSSLVQNSAIEGSGWPKKRPAPIGGPLEIQDTSIGHVVVVVVYITCATAHPNSSDCFNEKLTRIVLSVCKRCSERQLSGIRPLHFNGVGDWWRV